MKANFEKPLIAVNVTKNRFDDNGSWMINIELRGVSSPDDYLCESNRASLGTTVYVGATSTGSVITYGQNDIRAEAGYCKLSESSLEKLLKAMKKVNRTLEKRRSMVGNLTFGQIAMNACKALGVTQAVIDTSALTSPIQKGITTGLDHWEYTNIQGSVGLADFAARIDSTIDQAIQETNKALKISQPA